MIVRYTGRCGQNIPQTSGTDKGNRVLHPKGQHPGCIHRRSDGQVGQGKERPALADSPAVEMLFLYDHSRLRARFIYIGQLHTVGGRKTVIAIQSVQ